MISFLFLFSLVFCALFAIGCSSLTPVSQPLPARNGAFQETSLQRGTYVAAAKIDLNPSLMTQVKFLVEDGKEVKKGETICELVVVQLEETLDQQVSARSSSRIALRKAESIASFNMNIQTLLLLKATYEVDKKREEEEKNRELRDWTRITEERENVPVQSIEKDLARRRLQARNLLEDRGLGARSERLAEAKNLKLAELTASITSRLLPWLNDHVDRKLFFPAVQAYDAASQALLLARIQAEGVKKGGVASVEAARANLLENEDSVARTESQLASAVIRAETGGICLRGKSFNGSSFEKIAEGDRVFPGMSFLSIQDSTQFVIEMPVAGRDFSGIASGGLIRFFPDAYPEKCVLGRVIEIGPIAQEAETQDPGGERQFKVRALLDAPVPGLPTGAGGTVELCKSTSANLGKGISAERSLATPAFLVIGREALKPSNENWTTKDGYVTLPAGLEVIGYSDQSVAFRLPEGSFPAGGFNPTANNAIRTQEGGIPASSDPRFFTLKKLHVSRTISLPGEIRPRRRSLIAPPFSGKIASVLEDGTKVKRGETIGTMETNDVEKETADLAIQIKTRAEQLDLLKSKNLVELERARRKAKIAEGSLEVARLEHRMLLIRRDEDEIINLEKNRDLIASKRHVLEEQLVLEKDLKKRGLRSDLELQATELEIARQKREAAVNMDKLDYAVGGPSHRQIRLSELAVKEAGCDLSVARLEAEMASFSTAIEEEALSTELAGMNLKRSIKEKRMAEAPVKSPQDGVILQPEVWKMGQVSKVKAGDQLHRGVPFMHVADADDLEVRVEVPEMDNKFFSRGRPVEITVKSAPGKVFPGFVDRIGLIVDADNRARQDGFVEVFLGLGSPEKRIGLPDPSFRPGGTCEIKLVAYDLPEALPVPFHSLHPTVSQPLIIDEKGIARSFVPLFSDGLNGCFVASGLEEGQRVRLRDTGVWE
ncbi:MAG: efflux RND transporter periplasmic adaptor subunit [Candidatus Ozemobacteraceae bacterium]